ncbi:MAG TPA: AbgT family transporter [Acidobacteriota bacterium]|nr:AbgT family transporter [Acidobacteriota bacterium]
MPRLRVPHTLVLLFAIIVLAQILTYLLPSGSFDRETIESGQEVVVAGSYHYVEAEPLPPWATLTAVPQGIGAAAGIIIFIFIVGGAFAILRETGTADALIGFLLRRFSSRPGLLIAGGILVFTAGSSTIGMAEEYIPFVPILVALSLALGYDRITAMGILCIGYSVGYGCAVANPFTVIIAQSFAEIEPVSGIGFRLALTVVFLAIGIHHVWSYASRVRQDPSKSLMARTEIAQDESVRGKEYAVPQARHWAILGLVVAALALIVFGLSRWHWYLNEMGAIFLGLAILIAVAGRLSADRTAETFTAGAAELTGTALLIGFARTIQVVLEQGQVIDTIVYGISIPLEQLGSTGAAVGMYFFQSICNFFIPSGTGQVYVTMPLMVPLADLIGIERQVAVLAYQFGDGFTNILVPTNAVLVGYLALAQIPLDRWFRFVMPFMIKIWIAGSLALAAAVYLGYS